MIHVFSGVSSWPRLQCVCLRMQKLIVGYGVAVRKGHRSLQPMPDDDNPDALLRPLPKPPRCRGIPLGDGNYTAVSMGGAMSRRLIHLMTVQSANGSGIEGGFTPD